MPGGICVDILQHAAPLPFLPLELEEHVTRFSRTSKHVDLERVFLALFDISNGSRSRDKPTTCSILKSITSRRIVYVAFEEDL